MKGISSLVFVSLFSRGALGFTPSLHNTASSSRAHGVPSHALASSSSSPDEQVIGHESRQPTTSATLLSLAVAGLLASSPLPSWADDEVAASSPPPPAPQVSLSACKKNPTGATNCISTRNVKQLDLYSPPWTFESSAEEASARIKGVIETDPLLELQSSDGLYFKVKATRNAFVSDTVEILINAQDKVVTFRAEQNGDEPPAVSDFGAIKKELDSIRQRSSFGVMGQGIGAADSVQGGNGPLGQLKAFYGLQSGKGYEDVFDDALK